MANPLYNELMPGGQNPMLKQLMDFKKMLNGNPQEIVQNMVNSGRISQSQLNSYAQQANQIYRQFKGMF